MAKLLYTIFAAFLLSSCAGIGVFESADPDVKLNDAAILYSEQNRPLIAERLIFEAIYIYKERGNFRGLGAAHRTYGNLLRSGSVIYHENYYRKNGFMDESVTFDNRKEKASEYFAKAINYYNSAVASQKSSSNYDALTNSYYNLAWLHCFQEKCQQSCAFFDKAIKAYEANLRQNPEAKPQFSPQYGSLREQIEADKKRVGCVFLTIHRITYRSKSP